MIADTYPRAALPDAQIERVTEVGARRSLGPGAINREVIPPADLPSSSPFILLVEDFIAPQDGLHEHPHRGLETVTLVLSGEMEHVDHLGDHGISVPGDVQWMTAGRGIIHGGRPANGTNVHVLQLWLNLPSKQRHAMPGTRHQQRAQARLETCRGMTMHVYGEGPQQWSQYPMTLRDIASFDGGEMSVTLPAGRTFLYMVTGQAHIGGRNTVAGEVIQFAVSTSQTAMTITAQGNARIVAYSGQPIDEPVIAGGPFVAGSEEELRQAFADFRHGKIVESDDLRSS
jgi:redox-sensitive bicupin YhaK (pirin superfamily)